jgi:hypothetical protein
MFLYFSRRVYARIDLRRASFRGFLRTRRPVSCDDPYMPSLLRNMLFGRLRNFPIIIHEHWRYRTVLKKKK